jgi:hypothetical protein
MALRAAFRAATCLLPRAHLSAFGMVIASTLRASLYADGARSARHLSRMPRTEPRPSSFSSAIMPAVADTGLERYPADGPPAGQSDWV